MCFDICAINIRVSIRVRGLHLVPYIGNFIIPTDELIFFRGVGIPPTRQSFSICENDGDGDVMIMMMVLMVMCFSKKLT